MPITAARITHSIDLFEPKTVCPFQDFRLAFKPFSLVDGKLPTEAASVKPLHTYVYWDAFHPLVTVPRMHAKWGLHRPRPPLFVTAKEPRQFKKSARTPYRRVVLAEKVRTCPLGRWDTGTVGGGV